MKSILKINKNTINRFFSTFSLFLVIIGYQLFTSLVGGDLENSSTKFTIPFRAFEFIIFLLVILINIKTPIFLTNEIKLFLIFYLFIIARFFYDYFMGRYIILPEMGNKILLTSIFLTLIPIIGYLCSSRYVNYKILLYWIYIASSLAVFLTILNNQSFLEQTKERLDGNAALNTISTGHLGLTNLILGFLIYKRNIKKIFKYSIIPISLIAFLVMMRAASRGPILALVCVIGFYIFSISKRRIVGVLLLLFLIITTLIFLDYVENIINEISPALSQRIFDRDDALSDRSPLYYMGLQGFFINPFIGSRFALDGGHYPHNIFIEVLMQSGIIGFFIFLYITFKILYFSFIIIKKRSKYSWISLLFIQNFVLLLSSGSYVTNSVFCLTLCMVSIVVKKYYNENKQLRKPQFV